MKKSIQIATIYAVLAMVGGVFYREFTKFNQFTGITSLSKIHVHLFVLGMLFFLIVAIFNSLTKVEESKQYNVFLILYNTGLFIFISMLVTRGITQVLLIELTRGMDAAISGIAGIGHILVGIGLIIYLLNLKKAAITIKS